MIQSTVQLGLTLIFFGMAAGAKASPVSSAAKDAKEGPVEHRPKSTKCEPIPSEDFYILVYHGSSTRPTSRWPFENVDALDFDGDGMKDVMVPQPPERSAWSSCPFDVEWDLYAKHGECGEHLGRVRGYPKKVERGKKTTLETVRDNVGPMDHPTTFRYELDGGVFREVSRFKPRRKTRCQVHPESCVAIHCRLAGHPRGGFDYVALDGELQQAHVRAQECGQHIEHALRCDISLEFSALGKTTVMKAEGCGAATKCVRDAFSKIVVPEYTPYQGILQTSGSDFQLLPRPAD